MTHCSPENSKARLDHPMDVVRLRTARTALRNGTEGSQCHKYIKSNKPESSARTVTRNDDSGFFVGFTEMARPRKEIIGKRFARLTIIERVDAQTCRCICDCGNEKTVMISNLRPRGTTSCGCVNSKRVKQPRKGSIRRESIPEYKLWSAMLQRCENPNASKYPIYGGRGIRVCERWRDFDLFLSDVGPRPTRSHSIDRVDVNGDYEPNNVRWATATQQGRNRRNTVLIECGGVVKPLMEWAEETGLSQSTIRMRLKRGFPVEQVLGSKRLYKRKSL